MDVPQETWEGEMGISALGGCLVGGGTPDDRNICLAAKGHSENVGDQKANRGHIPVDEGTYRRWMTVEEVVGPGDPTTAGGQRTAGWEEGTPEQDGSRLRDSKETNEGTRRG